MLQMNFLESFWQQKWRWMKKIDQILGRPDPHKNPAPKLFHFVRPKRFEI